MSRVTHSLFQTDFVIFKLVGCGGESDQWRVARIRTRIVNIKDKAP